MIEGMTGFGEATAGSGEYRWTVEIRSLNHRFLDLSIRLPNTFSVWEGEIQKIIASRLKRGKVTVNASLANEKNTADKLDLDEVKLDFYVRTFKKIARRYHLQDQMGLQELIAIPNLFMAEKKELSEHCWKALKEAVEKAFQKLLAMRALEGRSLAHDLKNRVGKIKRSLQLVEQFSKQTVVHYRDGLQKRIQELSKGVEVDPDRLAREVAFYAERSDITEELVRAKLHLHSFEKSLSADGEAGKKFEFIVQEIHREVNTVSSKAQDFKVSNEVVSIKSELEKIREQIQNIV